MPSKRHTDKAQGVQEALQKLYGDKLRDLTSEGYQERLRQLREVDPAGARRVERILAPYLKKRIFPRRQREWHETSEGTRARLALLPGNPHVQADVQTIRKVLGIPPNHIHALEDDSMWKLLSKVVKRQAVRRVVEGNLAGLWLYLHRKAAMGQMTGEEDEEVLSPELRDSAVASAKANLKANEVPEWLRHPPCGPGPYDNPAVPMDWAARRLVERHRLPWHVATSLTFYILTQDPDWVAKLEPLRVAISYEDNPPGDPGAFTMSIKGIDEFITQEDWDLVWTQYVRPRQESLMQQRGMKPQGRRTVDIARLRKALSSYSAMVAEGLTLKEVLNQPPEEPEPPDQETIRRAIQDLVKLLTPKL